MQLEPPVSAQTPPKAAHDSAGAAPVPVAGPLPQPPLGPLTTPPAQRLLPFDRFVLAGTGLLALGGLVYAIADISYATLAGATDYFAYSWVWDLYGLTYLLVGAGFLLAFIGLGDGLRDGLSGWAGGLVMFGAILVAIGDFGYAAGRGHVPFDKLAWTDVLDAVGFFLLLGGIAVGIAGLAASHPRLRRTTQRSYARGNFGDDLPR